MIDIKGKVSAASSSARYRPDSGPEPPSYEVSLTQMPGTAVPPLEPAPGAVGTRALNGVAEESKFSGSLIDEQPRSGAGNLFGPSRPAATAPKRAFVYLHHGDRLGMQGFPKYLVEQVGEIIPRYWKAGVWGTRAHGEATEFRLVGMPFHGQKATMDQPRDLLLAILDLLSRRGYALQTSLTCSRLGRVLDQQTLFFVEARPAQRDWCWVMMHWTDKVRLSATPHPSVVEAVQTAVETWPLGVQSWKTKPDGALQAKLKGTPWYTLDSKMYIDSRQLLATLLENMDRAGYELVGSIGIATGADLQDPETMYFASKASAFPSDEGAGRRGEDYSVDPFTPEL